MCYKLDQSWILIDDKCSADQKLENILHIALSRNLTCLLRSSMNEARCRRSIRLGLCNPTQWREWKITRLPVTHTSIAFIFKKFLETRNIFLRYYFFRFSSFFPFYNLSLSFISSIFRWWMKQVKCVHSNLGARKCKEGKNMNYYRARSNIDLFHFYHRLWIRGRGPFASISREISSRVVKPSSF